MFNFEIKGIDGSADCQKYIESVISGRVLKLLPNKIKTEIDEKREPAYKRTCFIISLTDTTSIQNILTKSISNVLSLIPYVMSDELKIDNSNHLSMPINIMFSSRGLHLKFETELKDCSSTIHHIDIIGVEYSDVISKLDSITNECGYFESVELVGFLHGGMRLNDIKELEEYVKSKSNVVKTCFTSTYSVFREKGDE